MDSPGADSSVTVVVAARDEEVSIGTCLEHILKNDYPDYEVIVVDDFSSDDTVGVVREIMRNHGNHRVRLISLHDRMEKNPHGKAAAIEVGVDSANGSVILSTDADCVVGPDWIRAMMNVMTPEVEFVSGPVLFQPDDRWHSRLQAFEFLGLIAVGAGGIGSGAPNMCNSANIAYRKSTHSRMQSDIPSDGAPPDEVMLQLLHRDDPQSVTFCANQRAVVRTRPADSLREFISQRRRWAGNGARYPSPALMTSIILVYSFYVITFAAMIAAPFNATLMIGVTAILMMKVLVEACLTVPAARHFGQSDLIGWLLPGQLLQIPYVVLIGLAGVFGEVEWKNRSAH